MSISRYASRLLREFDRAAQAHGWERDQGNGPQVQQAEYRYKEAKRKLEQYIEAREAPNA
jgi:hypothetical protein